MYHLIDFIHFYMKKYTCLFFTVCLLLMSVSSYATWSIIVINPASKQIGIAGASCTFSVYGIGGIIPGKGAIIVQAMSNKLAKYEGLKMIMADASPERILQFIKDPEFDPEEQQYAIVCMNDINKPAVYTGKLTTPHKGALTAKGISVQGNTLSSDHVLQAVLNAALKAQQDSLSLEEVLMRALEAGSQAGGDKRCGTQKASSAFITVTKPNDHPNSPFLNLVVNGTEDNVNAVEALRKKFTAWKIK